MLDLDSELYSFITKHQESRKIPRIFQLLVREDRIKRAGQYHTHVLQRIHISFRILFVLRVALQSHSQQTSRMSQRALEDNGDDLCPRQGGRSQASAGLARSQGQEVTRRGLWGG